MLNNQKRMEHQLLDKYEPIGKMIFRQHYRNGGINKKFEEDIKALNYEIFNKKALVNAITYNPETKVLVEKRTRNGIFRILQVNDRQFLYIKRNKKTFLIEDKNEFSQDSRIYIILVFAVILLTLILSFIATLKKLIPLKLLKDKVSTLGEENFDFECCNLDGKDEVSLLAVEFKKSAKKLQEIKEARNIFIRNIMHELKTPITKGKFLTELERNEKNDTTLKEVFNRLELLINEFASIEELISSTKNIEKNFYFLDDILDNAKDILMIDDNIVEGSFENKKLKVNFKLFSIAVKNLIDNAIKYSSDKKVIVKVEDEDIIFENLGKELEFDLEKYYEPFFANEEKIKNSFGLGLYIVNSILKANNYTLFYDYKDGKNIFTCKKDKVLSTK